jgi:uncharacterized protein DUF6882
LLFRLFAKLRRLWPWPRSVPADLTPEADAWLREATAEFNAKQPALVTDWRLADTSSYEFDQDQGTFRLLLKDGSRAEGTGAIVGSFHTQQRTWEWAWNNPHVVLSQVAVSKEAQAVGTRLGLAYCLQGVVPCPDDVYARLFSAIALKAAGGQGIFFAKAGPVIAHIHLQDLKWVHNAA